MVVLDRNLNVCGVTISVGDPTLIAGGRFGCGPDSNFMFGDRPRLGIGGCLTAGLSFRIGGGLAGVVALVSVLL